ncbi:MAG TPA: CpaF family protein [Clostridiaceae bacterium]|nr:CpaF family protein [Clostridiaceae bacterium]
MRLTRDLKKILIGQILQEAPHADQMTPEELRGLIAVIVNRYNERQPLSFSQRRKLITDIYNSMRGLDILQELVNDEMITEIMVNGPDCVFYEKEGLLYRSELFFEDKEHLTGVISRYFGRANKLINEQKPIRDMRLSDGSRIHAVLPPIAPDGPILTIRRFTGIIPAMSALIENQTLSHRAADWLEEEVKAKSNIFISGGTGTGKTTFLNALSALIPPSERIVTIEDSCELQLTQENLVRLEARLPGPDNRGTISLTDLIRSSLRLRPDRIIVGEVRGDETYDMIQAMQTGHPGSMSTGHGNNPEEMLERLCLLLLTASQLPWEACRRMIASALDTMVHLTRTKNGQRIVERILTIESYDQGRFILQDRFKYETTQNKLMEMV